MAEGNTQIISSLYEAFSRRDMQALLLLLDPQIEVRQTTLLPWGGTYQGHQGIMSFAASLLEHLDSRVEPEEYVEAGDTVVAIGRTRGRVRANDREFDVRIVHVWTVKDGKALRFEAYIDTPKMLQALKE
jgi:ketosteroid isomerase-like protein